MRDKVHFRRGIVAGYDLNGDGRFKERLKGYNKMIYQKMTRIRLKKELIIELRIMEQ